MWSVSWARLFAEAAPLPGVKETLRTHAARLTPAKRPGDYAQAVMDLGATICTPRRPACGLCPWGEACQGQARGIAETLPVKAPKKAKPVRYGTAYLAFDAAGHVLVVRRPDKGLLGGMLALPSTDWAEEAPPSDPPFAGRWRVLGEVRHTFTHFHLRMAVEIAAAEGTLGGMHEVMAPDQAEAAMPTVFAKAMRLARGSLQSLPKAAR